MMDISSAYNSNNLILNNALNNPEALQARVLANREKEAFQEFESMFVQMTLKEMRPENHGDGLFNAGLAEDVFYQFLDEAIAKEVSRSENNFGIAEMMENSQQ